MNLKKQKTWELLWYLGVFLFLFVWFTRIHPLVVYNADDWTYAAGVRPVKPVWGDWNPTKVFPETFEPFVSSIALYVLMPVLKDYITSLTVIHALMVAGFITVYLSCFAGFIKRVCSLDAVPTILVSAVFLILHFLVFRTRESGNQYLFYCVDVNCYYNYLIPALINASLVMVMIENPLFDSLFSGERPLRTGLLLMCFYFAIYSNLVDSGILGVYAGSQGLLYLIRNRKNLSWKGIWKDNTLYAVILLTFLLSVVYELFGGRAQSAAEITAPLFWRIKESAYLLVQSLLRSNPTFQRALVFITLGAAILLVRDVRRGAADRNVWNLLILLLLAAVVMALYTIALCVMASPAYMERSEYLFGPYFFGLLLLMYLLACALKKVPRLLWVLPVILCVLFGEANSREVTFREATIENQPPRICAEISRDLVEQIVRADQAGLREMELKVPVWDGPDNWPHDTVLLPRMGQALYKHGLTTNRVYVTVVPSLEMNEKYNLPFPEK